MKRKYYITVLIAILIITLSGCGKKDSSGGDYRIMAFYEKGWDELTYGYPLLEEHYENINVLMPFWYTVKEDGTVDISNMEFEQKVVDFLDKHQNTQLIPLISNGSGVAEQLGDQGFRTNVIDNIEKLVNDNDFDGINIDFELLPPETREGLTAFVRELAGRLDNKVMSVSVFPKYDVTEDVNGAYDYAALAKDVDYVTIMTYDKHEESSGAGSIAPYDWIEQNIKTTLNDIPKEKMVICIGAYGYDWPVESGGEVKYLGLREILKLADEQGADIQWDDETSSPFFKYYGDDGEHEVWFENGESASLKATLANEYKIRGVAIWRLGFEDEDYWKKLMARKHTKE